MTSQCNVYIYRIQLVPCLLVQRFPKIASYMFYPLFIVNKINDNLQSIPLDWCLVPTNFIYEYSSVAAVFFKLKYLKILIERRKLNASSGNNHSIFERKKSTLQTNFEQKNLHGGKVCIFIPNV